MDFTTVNFNETIFLFGGYQGAVSDTVWTMNNDTFEFNKVVILYEKDAKSSYN